MPHEGLQELYFEIPHDPGNRLLGSLYLARGDTPKPTAVVLHGIPGIEKNYDLLLALRAAGWNALIFHYRGSWGSAGRYTFGGIPADVRAAIDTLTDGRWPMVDAEKLVLIGHSLGGWAAVLTAVRDTRVRAVCAIAPVGDNAVFAMREPAQTAPYVDFLPGTDATALATSYLALGDDDNPVNVVSKLAPRPLLVIHGLNDEVLPFAQHGQALYDAAAAPRQLLTHPEANHGFSWHRDWLAAQVVHWCTGLAF